MLQSQVVEINFGQGIDSKTDEKAVLETTLTVLENAVFDKFNTLKKRNGYDVNNVLVGNAEKPTTLGSLNKSKFVTSDNAVFSVVGSSARKINNTSSFKTETTITPTSGINNRLRAAKLGNYIAYLYTKLDSVGSTSLHLVIADYATDTFIKDISIGNGIIDYQIIAAGNTFYCFYLLSTTLYCYRLNSDLVTNSTETISSTLKCFYGIPSGNNIELVVGKTASIEHFEVTPSTKTLVTTFTDFGLGYCSATKDASGNFYTLGVNSSDQIVVIYGKTTGSAYTTVSVPPAVVGSSSVTGVSAGSNSILLFFDYGTKKDYELTAVKVAECVWGQAMGTQEYVFPQSRIASDAISYTDANGNTRFFIEVYQQAVGFETLLVGLQSEISTKTNFYPVSKSLSGIAYLSKSVSKTAIATLLSTPIVDGNKIKTPITTVISVETSGGVTTPTELGGRLLIHSESSSEVQTSLQFGANAIISSAFPTVFDGQNVFEHGFLRRPLLKVEEVVASGNTLAAGTYRYQAIYTYVDAYGQIHRSAPSDLVEYVSTGSSGKLTIVYIETCYPTLRPAHTVELYRTTAGGTILYRCQTINVPNSDAYYVVSPSDIMTDAELDDNAVIYTTGDILPGDTIPACVGLNTYRNRLVTVDTENDLVCYSKKRQELVGVEMPGTFRVSVNPVGGPLVTAIEMDSNLIIFRKSAIYATNGDGPNDAGANNDIREPQVVSSDLGCDDGCGGRSVVLTANGIMFKSAKGIYLLDRSLTLSYIGERVEKYNGLSLTSACVLSSKNQVRFQHSDGVTLVFDYLVKQWGVFTNHSGLYASVISGVYNYIRTNGSIWSESTSYADGTDSIIMRIKTAWIKLGLLQQFKRVRRVNVLGNYIAAHTATMKVYTDYKSTLNETHTFDASIVPAEDGVYQWGAHLKVQKCEAVQIEIYDTPTTANEAYSINNIALDVAIKQGSNKMKDTRSV